MYKNLRKQQQDSTTRNVSELKKQDDIAITTANSETLNVVIWFLIIYEEH